MEAGATAGIKRPTQGWVGTTTKVTLKEKQPLGPTKKAHKEEQPPGPTKEARKGEKQIPGPNEAQGEPALNEGPLRPLRLWAEAIAD